MKFLLVTALAFAMPYDNPNIEAAAACGRNLDALDCVLLAFDVDRCRAWQYASNHDVTKNLENALWERCKETFWF
jgi:hypothetical protein